MEKHDPEKTILPTAIGHKIGFRFSARTYFRQQWFLEKKGTIISNCFLFFLILTYFVSNSGWYEPARFVITGSALTTDAVINVQWDSGAGFNGYEQEQFRFLSNRGGIDKEHHIVVRGTDKKNVSSLGHRVVLFEILIDGKGVTVPSSALKNVQRLSGGGLALTSNDSEVSLMLPVSKGIHFLFMTNNRSGTASIFIDEEKSSIDLYRGNWEILFSRIDFWLLDERGAFNVSFNAPRYDVETLKITGSGLEKISSIYLQTQHGDRIDLPFLVTGEGVVTIKNPTVKLKKYFDPAHFIPQIIFALLVTWFIRSIWVAARKCGGVRGIFVENKRWLFWVLFGGASATYGIWLAAFWPGIMSVDSLNIWRAALLPEVMINNHPILNEISYMFFQQLWPHVAIVPIVHIFLLSTLIAVTIFLAYSKGVSLYWLLPCYLLILFSVPVCLYNVTLWKDVPFALLVVFWALVPAYLYFQKREYGKKQISGGRVFVLLLLFVALLTSRHNGLIYLLVIPPLLYFLGLVRISKRALMIGLFASSALVYFVIFPPTGIQSASYFKDLSRIYLSQIEKESIVGRLSNAALDYPRLLDIKKNQQISDFWHYYLEDRYAYKFIREVGWHDVYEYLPRDKHQFPQLRKIALQIYHASLDYPWLYFSWYPFVFLYLFPVSLLLCRWFPLSAIFSVVILTQILGLLVFVGTTNWRYYYFALLGGYFLLPLLLVDLHNLKTRNMAIYR